VTKNDAGSVASTSRKTTFGYENGRLKTIATDGGASTIIGYEDVASGDIGKMVHQVDTAGGLGSWQQITNHTDDGLAFVKSTKADGTDELQTPEARREPLQTRPMITATNAGVTRTTEFLVSGLPHVMTSTGEGPGSKERVEYYDAADANSFRRSLPSDVVSGEDVSGVKSHIDYPSIDQSIERGPRGVNTSTESDELGRPIHTTTSGTDDLSPEERFGYDGNGRLVRHAHKQGAKVVEEGYEYDVVDRVTRRTIYDGVTEVESTHTDYFVAQTNAITTTLPGGGTIKNTIDTLGRVSRSETNPNHPNATAMVTTTLYDIEDNPVFVTDDKMASVSAYDSAHRVRQTLTSDGTRTDRTLDGWNRTRSATTKNGAQTLATYGANFVGPQLQHVDDNARKQDFTWDGAGRTNSVVMTGAEQPRASQTVYDSAGRVVSSTFGEGASASNARGIRALSASISREFSKVENDYGTANTELPVTTTSTEDATHSQTWTLDHDTLGQTTHAGINGKNFDFEHHFDESGNVTSSKTPARRGETTYDYDARSFNTAEHLPGPPPATNAYAPDASGVLKKYTDPTGEPTLVTNDGIHRDLTLPSGATLGRAYEYDDATGSVGRLSGMHVTMNGTEVAGSSLLFEGLQRKSEQLLGVSGGSRFTTWSYDERGRVSGSVVATIDPAAVPLLGIPGASIVKLTDADFRTDLDRTVARPTDRLPRLLLRTEVSSDGR
jgi:YD repeat-containing protein